MEPELGYLNVQDVREIIGEFNDNGQKYYFGRADPKSLALKFLAEQLPETLVEDYEQRKIEGDESIRLFNPSGPDVHPQHKAKGLKLTLRGPTKRPTRNVAMEDQEAVPDSQEEFEDDEEEDFIESEAYPSPAKTRKSSRAATQKTRELPFSPKKPKRAGKNSRRASSEAEEIENFVIPVEGTRRSGRARTTRNVVQDDYDIDMTQESDAEDDRVQSDHGEINHEPPVRTGPRAKTARPAYGNIRHVTSLDEDVQSDGESAPLRAHRNVCEKCHMQPAHELEVAMAGRAKPTKGKRQPKKKNLDEDVDDEDDGDEAERIEFMGGWVRCIKCPVTAHWGCLASTQRQDITKAAKERNISNWLDSLPPDEREDFENGAKRKDIPHKLTQLETYQTTEFICGQCMKGGSCSGCAETVLTPDATHRPSRANGDAMDTGGTSTPVGITGTSTPMGNGDVVMADGEEPDEIPIATLDGEDSQRELLFRCITCRRVTHYECMPPTWEENPEEPNLVARALYYQEQTEWKCADCASYTFSLDRILAWRPSPPNAVEPPRKPGEVPFYKEALPREYLVKWQDRSYRRTQWVPHMWLVSTNHARLKNFLTIGANVDLLPEALPEEAQVQDDSGAFEIGAEQSRAPSLRPENKGPVLPSDPAPDAERRIPLAWKSVDRVLDILLWAPKKGTKKKKKGGRLVKRVETESDAEASGAAAKEEWDDALERGIEPTEAHTESVEEYEYRTKKKLSLDHCEQVVWGFFKWDDLGYDEATWDSPPVKGDTPAWNSYENAFKRFLTARAVDVPRKNPKQMHNREPGGFARYRLSEDGDDQPDLGQDPKYKLMKFQRDGVNWLCDNWWNDQNCILADEMGLGKTVQVATFIGIVASQNQKAFDAFPALVVVPNSTIQNWVREFERWAPKLRVVPFYGENKAREIIKKFELRHDSKKGAKFHVMVTTYETLVGAKDFAAIFKATPRWECLVIDEGQRLKNDNSLLFKKLMELNTFHRVIMTGTPLNNNIRELFNLMSFLDPEQWNDLEAMEKEHEELTEDLVKQLHNRLRPYFLRRLKSEVLSLPPKNEVIIPVSMTSLQKTMYKSVLSQNLDTLQGLTSTAKGTAPKALSLKKNMLMQLRKILQHPYLYADNIEPQGLTHVEAHGKLIDASAKLRFLKTLLPQLKARGHRVLLFSQFVIALDIIEDFLRGEGFAYLRLDGNTKGTERQKGMDEFNKPDSEIFIYLLTTRAGGVGINLWTADTVIIFDPDFNPHQDLQAIARSHRFGQTKTVLVFKLMVKDSAEERIMQTGKKKMVLDHLIVQKMDEDDDSPGENMQSILTFGAKALFEEESDAKDINYSEQDIASLILKTETETEEKEDSSHEAGGGLSFAFAKVWATDKGGVEELADAVETPGEADSWAQTLERIAAESGSRHEEELTGRGARRRAADRAHQQLWVEGPSSPFKRGRSSQSDTGSDAYHDIGYMSGADDSDGGVPAILGKELAELRPSTKKSYKKKDHSLAEPKTRPRPPAPIDENAICGLCQLKHNGGRCAMIDSSENLAEYRSMLMLHGEDEPLEHRLAAVNEIDAVLHSRGHMGLILGQPLALVVYPGQLPLDKKKRPRPSRGRASPPPSAAASTSGKRASSPGSASASRPKKKAKRDDSLLCLVCEEVGHQVKECSVVQEGSSSIATAIVRLENVDGAESAVDVLNRLLIKARKTEALARPALTTASRAATGTPTEVSD